MINFRFHIVSLIAVFLALAIGVVMGATVIDQAIVDGLNARINDVEREANAQRADNNELSTEVERLEDYIDRTDEYAVTGQLEDVPVAVVALRGVDADEVNAAVELARTAGASAPGVLWLEEKWLLPDRETRRQLADLLGEADDDRDTLRETGAIALADRLALGGAPVGDDVLVALEEAGFVNFEAVGDQAVDPLGLAVYPGSEARVLLVDGTDATSDMNDLVTPATRALVTAEVPLVVAEVFREQPDGPERGARIAGISGDEDLAEVASTVDALELTEGRVSAVLALSDLGRGLVGHYGYGARAANGVLPEASRQ
jgi:Copper transport outer membrane protein, MctB